MQLVFFMIAFAPTTRVALDVQASQAGLGPSYVLAIELTAQVLLALPISIAVGVFYGAGQITVMRLTDLSDAAFRNFAVLMLLLSVVIGAMIPLLLHHP